MQAQAKEVSVRLIPPTLKARQRLLRDVLRQEAQETNTGYLDCENRFMRVASSLVHLCTHTPFKSVVEIKSEELVQEAERFLNDPSVREAFSRARLLEIALATRNIKKAVQRMLAEFEVTEDDVIAYLRIADALRTQYLKEEYDPLGAINAESYAQALLIAANFGAYERTLNER